MIGVGCECSTQPQISLQPQNQSNHVLGTFLKLTAKSIFYFRLWLWKANSPHLSFVSFPKEKGNISFNFYSKNKINTKLKALIIILPT